jgi:hypothetical protein
MKPYMLCLLSLLFLAGTALAQNAPTFEATLNGRTFTASATNPPEGTARVIYTVTVTAPGVKTPLVLSRPGASSAPFSVTYEVPQGAKLASVTARAYGPAPEGGGTHPMLGTFTIYTAPAE